MHGLGGRLPCGTITHTARGAAQRLHESLRYRRPTSEASLSNPTTSCPPSRRRSAHVAAHPAQPDHSELHVRPPPTVHAPCVVRAVVPDRCQALFGRIVHGRPTSARSRSAGQAHRHEQVAVVRAGVRAAVGGRPGDHGRLGRRGESQARRGRCSGRPGRREVARVERDRDVVPLQLGLHRPPRRRPRRRNPPRAAARPAENDNRTGVLRSATRETRRTASSSGAVSTVA